MCNLSEFGQLALALISDLKQDRDREKHKKRNEGNCAYKMSYEYNNTTHSSKTKLSRIYKPRYPLHDTA